MLHLISLLILVLSFALDSFGAPLSECCDKKLVGDVEYVLKMKGDTSAYNCVSDCLYEKVNLEGTLYCFAIGNLTVECEDIDTNQLGVTTNGEEIPDFPTEIEIQLIFELRKASENAGEINTCDNEIGITIDYNSESGICDEQCENEFGDTNCIDESFKFKFNNATGRLEAYLQSTSSLPGMPRKTSPITSPDFSSIGKSRNKRQDQQHISIQASAGVNMDNMTGQTTPATTTGYQTQNSYAFNIPYWNLWYCPSKIRSIRRFPICCLHVAVYYDRRTQPFCCKKLNLC